MLSTFKYDMHGNFVIYISNRFFVSILYINWIVINTKTFAVLRILYIKYVSLPCILWKLLNMYYWLKIEKSLQT